MKVLILETSHYQYALTLSALFPECEKVFVTNGQIKPNMLSYSPELCNGKFYEIRNFDLDYNEVIKIINGENIDLLIISPVFDSYTGLNKIVKQVKCKKVLTTHNINTWFHARFWSYNSLLDKLRMKSIINHCDYIAVEDFIYAHLIGTNDKLVKSHKFIYIPYTLYAGQIERKYKKSDGGRMRVVLPGALDGARRRYEEVLKVIDYFKENNSMITFSFAGKPFDDYGWGFMNTLKKLKSDNNDLIDYFDEHATVEMFKKEMEMADIVLSVSTKTFNGMGTVEYIGKTKPTAAIHDMISYELPGLLPQHLTIPQNLNGSAFNYNDSEDLKNMLLNLLNEPEKLIEWKKKATENSLKFTPEKIRSKLPF